MYIVFWSATCYKWIGTLELPNNRLMTWQTLHNAATKSAWNNLLHSPYSFVFADCSHEFRGWYFTWFIWWRWIEDMIFLVNSLTVSKKLSRVSPWLTRMSSKDCSRLPPLPSNHRVNTHVTPVFSTPTPLSNPFPFTPFARSWTKVGSMQFDFPTLALLAPICWDSVHLFIFCFLLYLREHERYLSSFCAYFYLTRAGAFRAIFNAAFFFTWSNKNQPKVYS